MPKERTIDFDYGYRMLCESCEFRNWFSADEYAFAKRSGEAACRNCKKSYFVGPRFIDLRDREDEAVDKTKLHDLFWYHTTSEPNWPTASYRWSEQEEASYRSTSSPEAFERIRNFKGDQALHLGTYEAAVESMLSRMDKKDERHLQFYLYRVELKEDLKFPDGFRNENHEEAEKITQSRLRDQGVSGIRYLNAHESMGSISLAVVREAIKSTQRISLPVEGLADYPVPGMVDELGTLRTEADRHEQAAREEEPLSAGIERALGRAVTQSRATVSMVKGVPTSMSELVADEYLKDASPVLREQFCSSVQRPRLAGEDPDDQAWLFLFVNLAPVITRPEKVLAALDNQTPIEVLPA